MSFRKIAVAAFVGGTMLTAVGPANAVATTFASFSAIGDGSSIRWQNDGANGTAGSGGSLYTVSDSGSETAGSHDVSFSFLQPSVSPFVTNITASFSLSATTGTGNAAAISGTFLSQTVTSGTYSFLTQSAIVIGDRTFAAGSNLLTATFSGGNITGERSGTTATFGGTGTNGSTISYTSDFLDFDDLAQLEFGLSLTEITSALQALPSAGVSTRALRTFRSTSSGSFSSDPAPIFAAIPEPEVWTLMIVGFAMVGLQTRRRRTFAI